MKKRILSILVACLLFLAGCQQGGEETKIILTAGLAGNEIFRIESMSCTLPELLLVLENTGNQYETIYGEEIWDTELEGTSLEENVKETVLAQLAQVKTMNLLAGEHGVALSEEEKELLEKAAAEYFGTLTDQEKTQLKITEGTVSTLYEQYALAEKVYQYIIKDINPEISDDEARTITVQQIVFPTYTRDGTGSRIEYSETARAETLAKAREVLALAEEEDADFEQLALTYSEGEQTTVSFGKGEMDSAYEEAAFNLETEEISGIVETADGYYIIKCINTFNREETDANKVKIVEKRKDEVFGQEYETFVASLARELNTDLWETVAFPRGEGLTTTGFFTVFNSYWGS